MRAMAHGGGARFSAIYKFHESHAATPRRASLILDEVREQQISSPKACMKLFDMMPRASWFYLRFWYAPDED